MGVQRRVVEETSARGVEEVAMAVKRAWHIGHRLSSLIQASDPFFFGAALVEPDRV
jgi:hypothetical protein